MAGKLQSKRRLQCKTKKKVELIDPVDVTKKHKTRISPFPE